MSSALPLVGAGGASRDTRSSLRPLGTERCRPKARESREESGRGIAHTWQHGTALGSPHGDHLRNYIHSFRMHFLHAERRTQHREGQGQSSRDPDDGRSDGQAALVHSRVWRASGWRRAW